MWRRPRRRWSSVTKREWLAFSLAPALVAVAILAISLLRDPSDAKYWGSIAWPLVFVVYPVVFTAGIAYWELCKYKWGMSWPRLVLGGAFLGALIPLLFSLLLVASSLLENKNSWYVKQQVADFAAFVGFGAAVGVMIAALIRWISGGSKPHVL